MSIHYDQNYSKKEISEILFEIQSCIRTGRCTVAINSNRQENLDFIREYNISSKKQIQILLRIRPEDFCHSLQNTNIGFEYETLYVFCPQVRLFNIDDEEKLVDIYIKFNIIECKSGSRIVVISFHERNKPIGHCFR